MEKLTIKELRATSGMTQQAFANFLHIPFRTIQNWEYGTRKPPEWAVELIEYKLKNEGLI